MSNAAPPLLPAKATGDRISTRASTSKEDQTEVCAAFIVVVVMVVGLAGDFSLRAGCWQAGWQTLR